MKTSFIALFLYGTLALLSSCSYLKHQSEIDSKLEEIALDSAKNAEEANKMSLEEDQKERVLKREEEEAKLNLKMPVPHHWKHREYFF